MALELKSTSFKNGDFIPRQFTGQGDDKSVALQWQNVPEGTKSFNISPDKTALSEAIPTKGQLPDGSRQGINDFGQIGYGGPMPPPGKAHRYFFKLYALDSMLELKGGITKSELLKAMQSHILAQAELVGLYKR
jgi:phosphatidylethanolamine-binding protein (PEBP) family uncharacterized protein